VTAAAEFVSLFPQSALEAFLPESLPALTHPKYFLPLDIARQEIRTGRYRRALYTLYPLPASPDKAALEAEALLCMERPAETRAGVEASPLRDTSTGQRLLARAQVLEGQVAEAVARLQALLQREPADVQARAQLGALLEEMGDPAAALGVYQWVSEPARGYVAMWQGGRHEALGSPETILAIAHCLDREAYLTSRYASDRALHDVILGMYTRVYDVMDRGNPDARVRAAGFFLAHDDPERAMGELSAALRVNPNHPGALELVAEISSAHLDFARAEDALTRLRAVAPRSRAAVQLEIGSLLAQRQLQAALVQCERLIPRDVADMRAVSLRCAALALNWRREQLQAALVQAEKRFPNAGPVYHVVGEHYAAMRQYDDAERMLKRAVAMAPWMTEARNSLGLLYTQSGDEKAARIALEAARQLDPFNVRTTNYLRLLDEIDSFAAPESAHFVLLHDSKSDPFLAREMLEYMESHYARMTALYQHEPAQKTLIEVFPSHDRFSVRTTGSRWIATIGASTGRVIALVTPRAGDETMGAYEWGEVLRHELTHTLTLSATGNRIPHWLTEGLAVAEEAMPIQPEVAAVLTKATRAGKLFTLDTITWGFARPGGPHDRAMAYAQSYLMCRYIREMHGDAAIGRILQSIRENVAEKDAIQQRLGVSAREFESGFGRWMQRLVSTWGYEPEVAARYEELCKRGEALIAEKKMAEAVEVWKQASSLRPLEPLPHQRLAGLYLSRALGNPAAAAEHLQVLDRGNLKDARYAKRLVKLLAAEPQRALPYAQRATRVDPWDAEARDLLASILAQLGEAEASHRQGAIAAIIRAGAAGGEPR
jgi:tetratricopeptide (TPR) repeat protein